MVDSANGSQTDHGIIGCPPSQTSHAPMAENGRNRSRIRPTIGIELGIVSEIISREVYRRHRHSPGVQSVRRQKFCG